MKLKRVKLLYHGSDILFKQFDLHYAKSFKDFGRGFYLTTSPKQAQRWAQQKAEINHRECAYIYSFKLINNSIDELHLLELLQYDEEWLQFIVKCRFEGFEADYDVIYDRIADNKYKNMTDILQKYKNRDIKAEYAIEKIKMNGLESDQYCFKSKKSIEFLDENRVIRQYKDNKVWKQEVVRSNERK